ncbi:MAG: Zn-ribbon domain-containing OB-fold protein [Candidatus Altiarchaeota archaeon]
MAEGLALHWRLITTRYNLIGTECKTCGQKFFPPRNICPQCRRKSRIEKFKFSGNGEIYSYTIVRAAPTGFDYQKPYVIAIIKLDEGAMCTAQVIDCDPEKVRIGDKVERVFRKIMADDDSGIIRYGYKFKLKIPK